MCKMYKTSAMTLPAMSTSVLAGTLAEFGSDADAGTSPSEEGTKPADRHIDSLKLDAFAA